MPEPAGTNRYEGALRLRQNQGSWTRHPLSLRRPYAPQPAAVALDLNTLEVALVNPWWGVLWDLLPGQGRVQGSFTVRVREKSGLHPLAGLTVRLEQLARAPAAGLDLARHLEFRLNGRPAPNLAVWPPGPAAAGVEEGRSLPAGGQTEITGLWRGLRPGEYQMTLRFAAANAAESDTAKLALTARVRHGGFFAVLTLALALGLSWFLTKFLVFARRRLQLRQRLETISPSPHPAYRHLPAAVWSRALLAQVRRLSERVWLSGHEAIEAKLNQAAALATVFARASELRRQLDAAGLPTFVAHRVRVKLSHGLGNLPATRFDEAARDAALAALDALKVWLDDALFVEQYRTDLARDVRRLLNRVRPELITDTWGRQQIEALRAACIPLPADDLPALVRREEAYARLKVLWERRNAPEFGVLAVHASHIEDFFRLADDCAWQRIRQAHAEGRLRVSAPAEVQAFADLRFEAHTDTPDLDESFLLQHGLTWEWTWTLTPTAAAEAAPGRWTRWRQAMGLSPAAASSRVEITDSPCLVQFAPAPGRLEGRVKVRKREESLHLECPGVTVSEAREFGLLRGFEELEVWSTVVALGLALVSGLAARFFNVPTFGTAEDYLTLFLWGVGVDQAKNAWQLLSSTSSAAPRQG